MTWQFWIWFGLAVLACGLWLGLIEGVWQIVRYVRRRRARRLFLQRVTAGQHASRIRA